MEFDSKYIGPQRFTAEDAGYRGSTFAEVRAALFANAYYLVWGGPDEPPLPVYEVTLARSLAGLLSRKKPWWFQQASDRTVDSRADLRWGPDGRGFRRILHPNGVCLTGMWEIDSNADTGYTGYFKAGSRARIVSRYSACCTETRRGRLRSLSLVGKLYPTTDKNHTEKLATANFIAQDDLGGSRSRDISAIEIRNAPNVTPWRRGTALPVLLVTGLVLARTDRNTTIRQLYEIAELGKPSAEPTRCPEFMRLTVDPPSVPDDDDDLDFRDEILGRMYDRGDPAPKRTLTFHIEVSDDGRTAGLLAQRRTISNWRRIGRIVFDEAVASYNGDFVVHFHHPPWRNDRNDPRTVVHNPRRALRTAQRR
ncbi:MAG TPA: hypothetical protein VIU42_04075 [Xanthobacteraceae bacterium]